jgi:hypothetical protein
MLLIFWNNHYIHRVSDDATPPQLNDYKVDLNTRLYWNFNKWCDYHGPWVAAVVSWPDPLEGSRQTLNKSPSHQ